MESLAYIDTWALAAILTKALEYCAALMALGGPLFIVVFREAPEEVLRLARTISLCAALVCVAVLALRFGIRAARISGMGIDGMTDRVMLKIIWESPLGSAATMRAIGAFLVLMSVMGGAIASVVSLIGSVLIAISFTQVGHSLSEPRWLLSGLLTLHLLAVGFWVAALMPLHRAAALETGGALLSRFGRVASMTVPMLALVGLVFAYLMTGSLSALFTTAYGWTLLLKVSFFAVLLALAAKNKFSLVPALATESESAVKRLRRTIKIEGLAVLMILTTTASLTTITTPPVNL